MKLEVGQRWRYGYNGDCDGSNPILEILEILEHTFSGMHVRCTCRVLQNGRKFGYHFGQIDTWAFPASGKNNEVFFYLRGQGAPK